MSRTNSLATRKHGSRAAIHTTAKRASWALKAFFTGKLAAVTPAQGSDYVTARLNAELHKRGKAVEGLNSMPPPLPQTQLGPVREVETALVSHKYVTKRQALRGVESASA
jgi:hypothetical protein